MSEITKRLEVRLKDPNPVIRKLLEDWLKDTTNQSQNAKNTLQTALNSINLYPLPIRTGKECAILQGFGPSLCEFIDRVLTNSEVPSSSSSAFAISSNRQYEEQIKEVVKSVTKNKNVTKPKKNPTIQQKESPPIKMIGNNFKIYLIVDMAEKKMEDTCDYFEKHNILYEVRKLSIGDFTWLARDKHGNELVLPYIIERKRMDDLDASIRDGRFHEQKHRLKSCGVSHVIYLFENLKRDIFSVPLDTLKQAIVNTQVHDDFYTVSTAYHKESMQFLEQLTKSLIVKFSKKNLQNKTNFSITQDLESLCLIEFSEIYKDSARNAQVTIKELFIQQLLQLHSLTLEKAIAIVTEYPTPRSLIDAYKNCADKIEAQQLLSNIRFGPLMRAIGPKISLELYDFYETIF